MTFGEKVKTLREEKGLSQAALAKAIGVTGRTVRNWELKNLYPRKGEIYDKLANALGCETAYLVSSQEAFITQASEEFGPRGAVQAAQILEQAAAMFAGGDLSDEDKTAFMDEIQELYLDSKKRAKKFTPKKYIKKK